MHLVRLSEAFILQVKPPDATFFEPEGRRLGNRPKGAYNPGN
jgi:hypothetical protein